MKTDNLYRLLFYFFSTTNLIILLTLSPSLLHPNTMGNLHEDFFLENTSDPSSTGAPTGQLDGSKITIDNTSNTVTGTLNFDMDLGLEANNMCGALATPVSRSYTLTLPASGNIRLTPYTSTLKTLAVAVGNADCVKFTVTNAGGSIGGNLTATQGYYKLGDDGTDYTSFSQADTPWLRFFQLKNMAVSLSMGFDSTCVQTSSGQYLCMGYNIDYQLADATQTERSSPVNASSISGSSLSHGMGASHACRVKTDETVECWGDNTDGELGDSTNTTRTTPTAVSTITDVANVSLGDDYTCALKNDGSVWCWGDNSEGQLGIGNTTNKNTPQDTGITTASTICTGIRHACATLKDGTVNCWGHNSTGGIGDSTNTQRTSPTATSTISDAIDVKCGNDFTCALRFGGGIQCWGYNSNGRLGDDSVTNRNSPVDVTGYASSGAKSIGLGWNHACAITSADAIECWGDGQLNQLGNGDNEDRDVPTQVSGLTSGWDEVAGGGSHTCARTKLGGVKCWGYGAYGQLGNADTANQSAPVDAVNLATDITAYVDGALGYEFSCGLTVVGGVQCWGENENSQLGDTTTTDRLTPVDVSGLTSGVKKIAAGYKHACALLSTGTVKCWGDNPSGQLGDASTTDRSTPVSVQAVGGGGTLNEIVDISAGLDHTCAVNTSGAVFCWGENSTYQLGNNGSTTDSSTPVAVFDQTSGVSKVISVHGSNCVLKSGGVECWGLGNVGQLGNSADSNSSTSVVVRNVADDGALDNVEFVTGNARQFCALINDDSVICWGEGLYGKLGDGLTGHQNTPVNFSGASSNVQFVSSGEHHTCVQFKDDSMKCVGWNEDGQLGAGADDTTDRLTPVTVANISGTATKPLLGSLHSCVINSSGGIQCWGRNDEGQLGDNSRVDKSVPTAVVGLAANVASTIAEVEIGWRHACALSSAGNVQCWGDNSQGYLGDNNSPTDSLIPVFVHTSDSDSTRLASISQISLEMLHTCALTTGGAVWCWGDGNNGELGNDASDDSDTPVAVLEVGQSSGGTALSGISSISTGLAFGCALKTDNTVVCWGDNDNGQLGAGTADTTDRDVPIVVQNSTDSGDLSGIGAIGAGTDHTCAMTTAGAVWCWGDNAQGQLGNDDSPNDSTLPVAVQDVGGGGTLGGVVSLSVGAYHNCALRAGGQPVCWGDNAFYQLGDATNTDRPTPVAATHFGFGVKIIDSGRDFTCYSKENGSVKCAGRNTVGQLGDGTSTTRTTAVDVVGLPAAANGLSATLNHACATLVDNSIWCWAENFFGEVGDGTTTRPRERPSAVGGLFK